MNALKFPIIILISIFFYTIAIAKEPSKLIEEIVDEAALVLSSEK